MNIEHYENLVGILSRAICSQIFEAGDKLMSLLEHFGVEVEYGDGDVSELCPGNTYTVSREEGQLEEYEDDMPPEEWVDNIPYFVNIETGMAESRSWYRQDQTHPWPIQPWLLSLIRQHNLFHVRAYYVANAAVDHLGEGEIAIKYLDGEEWGYEVFKDGQPVRRLPEGRDRL